jgi:hypothetical protein
MSTKFYLPVCAALVLLAACGDRNDQSGTYSKGPNGTGTEADQVAKPGDTSTTPGGMAGDAANTTSGTNDTPPSTDTPPSEPSPPSPPQ